MDADRWRKIEALYAAAQAVETERRAAFLEESCPGDASLRQEVESLLLHGENAGDFLDPPVATETTAVLSAGRQLGSFEILGLLGKGGMGQVYRARDTRLGRDVAIKVLPPEFGLDADRAARFEREARATSALNHPNILSVYDIGRDGDLSWMVCELVEGQSLRQALAGGPMRPQRAVEIAAQIADGLAAAHAAGVVHRDLKPENVMLTRDERVKILDFGIAKWRPPAASGSQEDISTQTGAILGTPAGMSPEQVLGAAIDHRSDLFSLGVLLFEMLTGRRPFAGDAAIDLMNAIAHGEPEDLPAEVPEGIAKIVRRTLAKRPEQRFQSAADLAFALRMTGETRSHIAVKPTPRWNRWWRAAVVAAMLALALAGGWSYIQPKITIASQSTFPGTLRRLTWDEGLTADAAISPDGKLVAYASDRGNRGNLDIYVQQVDGGGVIRLTTDPADHDEPTFTPDGTRVAFQSSRDGSIYEVPALGGESRMLVAGGRHPRFSPDGQFILYSVGEVTRFRSAKHDYLPGAQLYVRALAGGTPVLVSKGCIGTASAVWSPDSQHILFVGTCEGAPNGWLTRRDGTGSPQPTGLGKFWFEKGMRSPAGMAAIFDQWLPNPPRLLLPLIERDAAYEAVLPISPDGTGVRGSAQRLTFGPGTVLQGSAATNGRVALSSGQHTSNLWRLAVDEAGHAKGAPVPLTTEQSMSVNPELSGDGRHVAFVSMRGSGASAIAGTSSYQLRVLDLATGTAAPITWSRDAIGYPVFREADKITYLFTPQTINIPFKDSRTTREVGAGGGEDKDIFPIKAGIVTAWSPDGNSCLTMWANLNRLNPVFPISWIDRRTSREVCILRDPKRLLAQARFSHDGRWITFNAVADQHSRIYIAPFREGPIPVSEWIPLTDGAVWDDVPRLSPDDKRLYFISERDGFRCIWAERLGADMRPVGALWPVYHFHAPRRSLAQENLGYIGLSVGRGELIFNQGETTGNVWLLDPNER